MKMRMGIMRGRRSAVTPSPLKVSQCSRAFSIKCRHFSRDQCVVFCYLGSSCSCSMQVMPWHKYCAAQSCRCLDYTRPIAYANHNKSKHLQPEKGHFVEVDAWLPIIRYWLLIGHHSEVVKYGARIAANRSCNASNILCRLCRKNALHHASIFSSCDPCAHVSTTTRTMYMSSGVDWVAREGHGDDMGRGKLWANDPLSPREAMRNLRGRIHRPIMRRMANESECDELFSAIIKERKL